MASAVIVAAVFLLRWAIIAWAQVYLTRRGGWGANRPEVDRRRMAAIRRR